MIHHLALRFKLLNCFHLEEIVSMGTVFMAVIGLHKWSCAQVFYGLKSHMINVYGMESKAGVLTHTKISSVTKVFHLVFIVILQREKFETIC
jgi:hypothetical protein